MAERIHVIPGNIYRAGPTFYTYNEDCTERVVDHEHIFVPADPMDLDSESICNRCYTPATQSV